MKKYFFLLLASCLVFSSCSDFEAVTFSGIENVKIINLSQQGAEAEITAKIKNPNSIAFTIYQSDLDVMINGINSGKAHLSDNVKIKSKSEEAYIFKIKSEFSTLSLTDLPRLMSIVMSKNVKVELKGNLKVGNFFMKRNHPVDISQDVSLDK